MGQFMLPIPLNVPVALAMSLFVAYVFTPYLAKKLIKRPSHNHNDHKPKKSLLKKIQEIITTYTKASLSWKK